MTETFFEAAKMSDGSRGTALERQLLEMLQDVVDGVEAQSRALELERESHELIRATEGLKQAQEHKKQLQYVIGEATRVLDLYGETLKRVEQGRVFSRGQLAEARQGRDELARILASAVSVAGGSRPASIEVHREPLSDLVAQYLASRTDYSVHTREQARGTFRLWAELIGDAPPADYTGKDAGRFLDLMRRLPSSHGKSRSHVPAAAAIATADASGAAVPRLTEKTVKRHASSMSQLWTYLMPLEHVSRNIFEGFRFPGTKAGRTKRSDWSADDLARLAAQPWRSRTISLTTYRWLVGISMFSGMRLEEICRLRPDDDIKQIEKVWCFVVQSHQDGWEPKSEAGERVVPIHPALIAAGVMKLAKGRTGKDRLFHDLAPGGPDGKLGFEFSRQFSKHKAAAGVGPLTVFHSFRHSVSTILRNADASIRSEWIDAVLGHEGEQKSMGATVYLKRIGIMNLDRTVRAIHHPDAALAILTPDITRL